MEDRTEIETAVTQVPCEKPDEILSVSHLYKKFKVGRKQKALTGVKEDFIIAVNDLSFSAYRGEIFGLLGPNGAGKTTTLRILSTLIKPDGGDATIDGDSVLVNSEKVRSKIGFLTSELKLEEFFTPDYLFDFFSELRGVDKTVREERKKRLFSAFGIDKFAGVKVGNLSTGMKQAPCRVVWLRNSWHSYYISGEKEVVEREFVYFLERTCQKQGAEREEGTP